MVNLARIFFLLLLSSHIAFGQVKLSSEIMDAIEARCIGPATMSGRITAIEACNKDPKILYIGSAGGGVWKSTNGGVSFKSIFDPYCQSIGALVIDQERPDTIWAGTGESNMVPSVSIGNGIYLSTDGGNSWQLKGLEKSEHISKIIIHPRDPNVLFVAVPGALWNDSQERGLYKTIDGGASWTKSLYVDEKTGCTDVFMDRINPDIMYASTWEFRQTLYSYQSGGPETALFKSVDGGASWVKLTEGLPDPPYGRIALTMAPRDSGSLFAMIESEITTFYASGDQGVHWTPLSSSDNTSDQALQFRSLVADPKDPNKVYQLGYNFSISSDGGLSFTTPEFTSDGVHTGQNVLWINPNQTNHLLVGTDGGVYESKDGGHNFSFLSNLPISQVNHIALDQQEPCNLYGGFQDNGSWQGPTTKIGGIKNSDWQEIYAGDGSWVIPDLREPDIVFVEEQYGDMLRINKRTLESQSIMPYQMEGDEKLRFNRNTPIVPSPTDTRRLYTGSQYLYLSRNQGRDWTKISGDLSSNDKSKQAPELPDGLMIDHYSMEMHCSIVAIAESALDSNLIYVGTDDGKLQKTIDQGKTWQELDYTKTGIPAGSWVSSIEPSRFSKNVVYASFDNHANGDHNTYLALSRDGGLKWERLQSQAFTGYAHKIKEDLKLRSLLFLGTEMGLFVSVDAGKNWARYESSFPPFVAVYDLTINGRTNDLIIGTHGRGIYIVDDITTLRQLTPEMLTKNAAVLDSRQTILKSPVTLPKVKQSGEFVSKNYTEAAIITYYLKEPTDTTEVRVKIYDKAGKLMYELPGSNEKGVNKLFWNMRMRPPKVCNLNSEQPKLSAPLVDPGEYKTKLWVDTIAYEGKLILIEDPKSQHSAADKALQRSTAKELMNLVGQLNFNAHNIIKVKEALHTSLPEVNSGKDQKVMADYEKALEALRKKMLGSKEGKSIHGEEPLRDKLNAVYQAVCSYDGRPSNEQLQKKAFLVTELTFYQAEITETHELYLLKTNKILEKNNLPQIELMTEAEWNGEL